MHPEALHGIVMKTNDSLQIIVKYVSVRISLSSLFPTEDDSLLQLVELQRVRAVDFTGLHSSLQKKIIESMIHARRIL